MSIYNCIDDYKLPENSKDWLDCPECGLKPKVWLFDNGRSTACGCWKSKYNHFSIHAESIISVQSRTGKTEEYDFDALRKNWNVWCKTGEIIFNHAGKRSDNRW